jgi:hypothetical protein
MLKSIIKDANAILQDRVQALRKQLLAHEQNLNMFIDELVLQVHMVVSLVSENRTPYYMNMLGDLVQTYQKIRAQQVEASEMRQRLEVLSPSRVVKRVSFAYGHEIGTDDKASPQYKLFPNKTPFATLGDNPKIDGSKPSPSFGAIGSK